MKPLAALVPLLLLLFPEGISGIDLRARSTSSSKQFIIYCDDAALRGRVAGFVEDVKQQTYELVEWQDRGQRIPIVVMLQRGESRTPVSVRLFQTPEGPTIHVDARIGDNPADVHLQKHIIRAVMLDFLYRDRAALKPGEAYVEAPWWFVCGVIENYYRKDRGVDAGFYRKLVATNKLPSIEQFLDGRGLDLGATAAAFDSACALAFVDMLIGQPDGKSRLASLMRSWPDVHGEQIAALVRLFPGLGTGAESIQKWWTLSLAKFSASDRYLGLSAEETDRELSKLLEFPVVVDKKGKTERFAITRFPEFVKLPGAKPALKQQRAAIIGLSTRANAIFRPVLVSYDEIFALLGKGKTKRINERIRDVEVYRTTVLHRMSEIEDYLNWYEATQMGGSSKPFEAYLSTAKQLDSDSNKSSNSQAISDYLDLLEEQLSAK
jgi:hypothetical protein